AVTAPRAPTGVPVLTFVSSGGSFVYECQNRRDTSKKYQILAWLWIWHSLGGLVASLKRMPNPHARWDRSRPGGRRQYWSDEVLRPLRKPSRWHRPASRIRAQR